MNVGGDSAPKKGKTKGGDPVKMVLRTVGGEGGGKKGKGKGKKKGSLALPSSEGEERVGARTF